MAYGPACELPALAVPLPEDVLVTCRGPAAGVRVAGSGGHYSAPAAPDGVRSPLLSVARGSRQISAPDPEICRVWRQTAVDKNLSNVMRVE